MYSGIQYQSVGPEGSRGSYADQRLVDKPKAGMGCAVSLPHLSGEDRAGGTRDQPVGHAIPLLASFMGS